MNDAGDALEAHAGIHMFGRQRVESPFNRNLDGYSIAQIIGAPLRNSSVVLDEDVVPDLDAAGVGAVDELGAGGLRVEVGLRRAGAKIHVDFGARTARAGFAHHPEVIFLAAVDDVDGGVKADAAEFFRPEIPRFFVAVSGIVLVFVRLVNRGVDALRWKFPDFDNEFPRPRDGFFLEVIAEAPVAEHLEKSVVISVETDIVEVVVLATGADAFLGVGGAARRVRTFRLAEEDGHELVHAGVGEQQIRRVRHQRGRRDDGVRLRFEKIEERLADLRAGHHAKMSG